MDHRIRGEVAGVELAEIGAKYFLDVRATARRMLEELPGPARTAFSAAVTGRVLDAYPYRDPQIEALAASGRPVLELVWDGLGGAAVSERIAESVGKFYVSGYFAAHRHDDPASMAGHVAMTVLYTAECYLHGCWEFAAWAGWRGFDVAAIHAAEDEKWPHRRPGGVTPYAWELAHPLVQAELERQLTDLELLSSDDGLTLELLERVRGGAEALA